MNKPKWTVLSNLVSKGSEWIGTSREFFDDKIAADNCYKDHIKRGNCPALRPYNHNVDKAYLGAVHRELRSNDNVYIPLAQMHIQEENEINGL